jgi:hypothetical protein
MSLLKALQGRPGKSPLLVVCGEQSFVPLSLGLWPSGKLKLAESLATPAPCPQATPMLLAQLLPPPVSPSKSPMRLVHMMATAPAHGKRHKFEESAGLHCSRMNLRSRTLLRGQQASGLIPEYVQVDQFRKIGNDVLEIACTMVCRFCQATAPKRGATAKDYTQPVPATAVYHGFVALLNDARRDERWSVEISCGSNIDVGLTTECREEEISDGSRQACLLVTELHPGDTPIAKWNRCFSSRAIKEGDKIIGSIDLELDPNAETGNVHEVQKHLERNIQNMQKRLILKMKRDAVRSLSQGVAQETLSYMAQLGAVVGVGPAAGMSESGF